MVGLWAGMGPESSWIGPHKPSGWMGTGNGWALDICAWIDQMDPHRPYVGMYVP